MDFQTADLRSVVGNGVRIRTRYQCGADVEVIPDQSHPEKFHCECHNCGASEELTRTAEK